MFYTADWKKVFFPSSVYAFHCCFFVCYKSGVERKANENKVKTESSRISEWSEVVFFFKKKFNYGKVFFVNLRRKNHQTTTKNCISRLILSSPGEFFLSVVFSPSEKKSTHQKWNNFGQFWNEKKSNRAREVEKNISVHRQSAVKKGERETEPPKKNTMNKKN